MDERTGRYYEQHAQDVARLADSIDSPLQRLFAVTFRRGQRVADVGCGSGRDLCSLLLLGVDAVGVEPSPALRKLAVANHRELRGRVLPGSLPDDLSAVSAPLDGVVLSAVISHLDNADLFATAFAIRGVLKKGGTIVVSFCTERPNLEGARDAAGRLFVIRTAPEVALVFERLGFAQTGRYHANDAHGRSGVAWTTLILKYQREVPRPIDSIESIITRDHKTATYKLALLRALSEIAVTSWREVQWESDGRASVSVGSLAERWIRYYWPFVDQPQPVPQLGKRPMAFQELLRRLADESRSATGGRALAGEDARGLSPELARQYASLLKRVGQTIVRGPVVYAGGAEGRRIFQHDRLQNRVLMSGEIWRELVLMGSWVRDAVILRWAQMAHDLSGRTLSVGDAVALLMRPIEETRRTDEDVRNFYLEQPALTCIWTGARLRSALEVDHVIPYSLWQDSSLWNLLPASRRANNAKRDKLPTQALLEASERAIHHDWQLLADWRPQRFFAAASRFVGPEFSRHGWPRQMSRALREAVEYTANLRAVERWEPTDAQVSGSSDQQ